MTGEMGSLEVKGFWKELEIHFSAGIYEGQVTQDFKTFLGNVSASNSNLGQEGNQTSDLNPYFWNKVQ